jgi:hypothetical protein
MIISSGKLFLFHINYFIPLAHIARKIKKLLAQLESYWPTGPVKFTSYWPTVAHHLQNILHVTQTLRRAYPMRYNSENKNKIRQDSFEKTTNSINKT